MSKNEKLKTALVELQQTIFNTINSVAKQLLLNQSPPVPTNAELLKTEIQEAVLVGDTDAATES